MSKWITVYGVYYWNHERNRGYSDFYDTPAVAHEMTQGIAAGWYVRLEAQTYEVED